MSKSNPNVDSTGSIPLTQYPPQISLNSPLLSWLIPLPTRPLILYAVFTPAASVDSSLHLSVIESARRSLVASNNQLSILDSLLPSVQVNQQSSTLYVFAISSTNAPSLSQSNLTNLSFDSLIVSDPNSFTPHDLYPCSLACSTQRNPCPTCLNPQHSSSPAPVSSRSTSSSSQSSQSVDCLLPRRPLREPYSQFLRSVRDHILQQITEPRNNARSVTRYSDGFLLSSQEVLSEWGVGWDHHTHSRTIISCQLDVHLSPSRLTIHPVLRPTHFLPLLAFLPVPPGTPIKLLPYGAPAYYLATYTGPTSALTGQFEASLAGLGAGDWKPNKRPAFGCPQVAKDPTYVITWVSVQNKQGEDKGIIVIWPASLCLSFHPSSPQAKQILPYIPELPPQLQPSPLHAPTNIQTPPPREMDTPMASFQARSRQFVTRSRISSTGDSVRALRALTLSKTKNIHEIAHEVSGHVDSVAKERERERERIRKGREQAQSPPKPTPTLRENPSVSGPSAPDESLPDSSEEHILVPDHIGGPVPLVAPEGATNTSESLFQLQEASNSEASSTVKSVTTPVVSQISANSYDPFTTFNTSWSRPTTDFSAMDMDYNMGFDINMNSLGVREEGGGSERFNMDLDDGFGAFTDDDFSFFDRPAVHGRSAVGNGPSVLETHHIGIDTALIPAARFGPLELTSPLFNQGTHETGPGPPSATPGQSHPSPWTSGVLGEGFTPRFSNSHTLTESTPRAPELVPSSPTSKTPFSYSAPATPTVHVAHDPPDSLLGARRSSLVFGPTIFDPIAFASSHRMADDKYAFGKFALPSPPDEEDRTESFSSFSNASGWKTKYDAITNPKVSVVRRLIGAKRKIVDQGGRDGKISPSWVREQEEWQNNIIQVPDDVQSDVDSDDEEEALFEEEEEVLLRTGSDRPSTPPPSYLPLGPSLLTTQFHHSHLLPISTPLRPPGAAVAATNLGTTGAPISVPTPVSPPAMLGEKSRSLEAAATMLAKEVVENCIWFESYGLNLLDSTFSIKPSTEVCQADVKRIVRLLAGVEALQGPLEMGTLFNLDSASLLTPTVETLSLHPMDPPLLSVGKSDVAIEILPPALRFWEKLGLTPRGGVKNVTSYVFFEEQEDDKLERVSRWLDRVSIAYSARNFGTHTPGTSSSCLRDGVLPVRFDSFRKTLPSLIAELPPTSGYIVFYIATPASITTLASPILRQVFSAAKRALKNCSDSQILFQFVSESTVLSSINDDPTDNRLGAFVSSVYDRILKPVDRSMSRRFFDHSEKARKFFQDTAFVLGRPRQHRIVYVQQAPALSLDVQDRHTLLHVGYRISSCSRWLFAVCVDQRGESHDLGVWLNQHEEGSLEGFMVGQLWNFAVNVAKAANIEWRIVFAKLGIMGEREMDAWINKLGTAIPACEETPMMHVTLVSTELDTPWTFISPAPTTPRPPMTMQQKNPAGTRFEDISATTYALLPPAPMALSPVPLRHRDVRVDAHFVADYDDTPTYDMSVRPLSTATIIRVPADTDYTSISMLCVHLLHTARSPLSSSNIADEDTHLDIIHNFHELAVLAKVRWRLDKKVNPILPFHLAALEVIDETLAGELPSD